MNIQDFFNETEVADDGFGDTKQGIFGLSNHRGYFLSDGLSKVVEVSYDLYRNVDVAFGQVYDKDEITSSELEALLSEAGL